jgi:hypothetical protein
MRGITTEFVQNEGFIGISQNDNFECHSINIHHQKNRPYFKGFFLALLFLDEKVLSQEEATSSNV